MVHHRNHHRFCREFFFPSNHKNYIFFLAKKIKNQMVIIIIIKRYYPHHHQVFVCLFVSLYDEGEKKRMKRNLTETGENKRVTLLFIHSDIWRKKKKTKYLLFRHSLHLQKKRCSQKKNQVNRSCAISKQRMGERDEWMNEMTTIAMTSHHFFGQTKRTETERQTITTEEKKVRIWLLLLLLLIMNSIKCECFKQNKTKILLFKDVNNKKKLKKKAQWPFGCFFFIILIGCRFVQLIGWSFQSSFESFFFGTFDFTQCKYMYKFKYKCTFSVYKPNNRYKKNWKRFNFGGGGWIEWKTVVNVVNIIIIDWTKQTKKNQIKSIRYDFWFWSRQTYFHQTNKKNILHLLNERNPKQNLFGLFDRSKIFYKKNRSKKKRKYHCSRNSHLHTYIFFNLVKI